MRYITTDHNAVYHYSVHGERSLCGEITDNFSVISDTDGYSKCKTCAVYDDALDLLEDEWVTPPQLADRLGMSRRQALKHCNRLYNHGAINRRPDVNPTDGGKGYAFSQLERSKTEYQGNNNLFESMLSD